MSDRRDRETYWLDKPKNIDRLIYALWAACLLLAGAEFWYTAHAYFVVDGWFAFNAVFGFVAYCFVVFSAKGLRVFVARRSNYYGDRRPLAPGGRDEDADNGR